MIREISQKVKYEQRPECEEERNTIPSRGNNNHKGFETKQTWNIPEAQGKVKEAYSRGQINLELARS